MNEAITCFLLGIAVGLLIDAVWDLRLLIKLMKLTKELEKLLEESE